MPHAVLCLTVMTAFLFINALVPSSAAAIPLSGFEPSALVAQTTTTAPAPPRDNSDRDGRLAGMAIVATVLLALIYAVFQRASTTQVAGPPPGAVIVAIVVVGFVSALRLVAILHQEAVASIIGAVVGGVVGSTLGRQKEPKDSSGSPGNE